AYTELFHSNEKSYLERTDRSYLRPVSTPPSASQGVPDDSLLTQKRKCKECSSEFSFLWTTRSALNKHYLLLHAWHAVQVDQYTFASGRRHGVFIWLCSTPPDWEPY